MQLCVPLAHPTQALELKVRGLQYQERAESKSEPVDRDKMGWLQAEWLDLEVHAPLRPGGVGAQLWVRVW